jgi:tetratricopeptide (TPR) repeat protein
VIVVARLARRALVVTLSIAGAAGVTSHSTLAAAQTTAAADESSRRDALQHFRDGQQLMAGEQFERAVDAFGKAVERDPLLSIAHYQRGQAYMNLRRYASATKSYKDCIEALRALDALQATNRFKADRLREDEIHEMRESIRVLEQLASRYPTRGYALKVTQAEEHLRDLESRRAVSAGDAFHAPAEILLALGSAYFRDGDRDGAEAQWRAAIDANPKLGEAHNNIAVIYMQTDRFDQAFQELTLAEKAGFKVNPQFKADLKERAKRMKN